MQHRWLYPLILSLALAGCSSQAPKDEQPASADLAKQADDRWTFENYDSSGYTFKREGMQYRTKCFLIENQLNKPVYPAAHQRPGTVFEGKNSFHLDVTDQAQCNEILPYLHKTIALVQGEEGFSELFYFIAADGARIEFASPIRIDQRISSTKNAHLFLPGPLNMVNCVGLGVGVLYHQVRWSY